MKTSPMMLFLAAAISLIPSTSPSCPGKTLIYTGVTNFDKQTILDVHNKMRQVVALGQVGTQPPAANMNELIWNDKLAYKAQQWATACSSYIHDPARHQGEYLVGQNIATKWTTKAPATHEDMQADWYSDAIAKWFGEHTLYNFNDLLRTSTGHYTQLIWAETTSIGCGFAYYLDDHKKYTKKYVCNYGPSGNVIGVPPYRKGYPNCFGNGLATSAKYSGLCEVEPSPVSYPKYHDFNNYFSNNNYKKDNGFGSNYNNHYSSNFDVFRIN